MKLNQITNFMISIKKTILNLCIIHTLIFSVANLHASSLFKKSKSTEKTNSLQPKIIIYPDQSKIIIYSHPDNSRTVDFFNADQQFVFRNQFNSCGRKTHSHTVHPDKTETIIQHKLNKSQDVSYFDTNGQHKYSAVVYSDQTQSKINIDKQSAAWHEAGHALASMYHYALKTIDTVTIETDPVTKNDGCVKFMQNYNVINNRKLLRNNIIIDLSGLCAEQILQSESMLTDRKKIIQLLSFRAYSGDLCNARQDAQNILTINKTKLPKTKQKAAINRIITDCYPVAYQSMIEHQNELESLAATLLEKKNMKGNDVHDLLKIPMSLKSNEQGPLPEKYLGDYAYRQLNRSEYL